MQRGKAACLLHLYCGLWGASAQCGLQDGPTPWEGALVHLLGGAPAWEESGHSDFISGFFLPVETKMKWKNNICEAYIMYLALHLRFYLL